MTERASTESSTSEPGWVTHSIHVNGNAVKFQRNVNSGETHMPGVVPFETYSLGDAQDIARALYDKRATL